MKLLYEVSVPPKANGTIVLPVGVISNAGINQCNNGDAAGNLYVFVEELGGHT